MTIAPNHDREVDVCVMLRDRMYRHDGTRDDWHRAECGELPVDQLLRQNHLMATAIEADISPQRAAELLDAAILCLRRAAVAVNADAGKDAAGKLIP